MQRLMEVIGCDTALIRKVGLMRAHIRGVEWGWWGLWVDVC